MKKIKKYFLVVIISIILSFVLMSSVIQLYKDRGLILTKLGFEYDYWGLETPNKTYLSEKQLKREIVLPEKLEMWKNSYLPEYLIVWKKLS